MNTKETIFDIDDSKLCILFGSRTRVKLLRIFLTNPEKAYFVRELTRLTDSQINAVRRELDNLLKIGIVFIDKQRKITQELEELKQGLVIRKGIGGIERKYFSLNKDFVLAQELNNFFKKLVVLSKNTFVQKIQELGELKYLTLLGCFIGENESAIDLLIVGDLDKGKLDKLIQDLSQGMGKELNYTHMTEKEFAYRKEIVDKFLYNILENRNKIVLIDNLNKKGGGQI